ncbi:MAG: hypothetical protein WB802_13620 [Candidatus Dormiibacterota bacterium]|jgi:hypothetical protein
MKARWILVAGLALLAAGCGGSTTPSTATPSPSTPTPAPASTAQVAQAYLSAAAAVDAAYTTWTGDLHAANGNVLQLKSQAAAYAAVLTSFDSSIQGIGATGQAAADIATLVTDDNAVIADLNALPSQTASTETAWDTKAISDGLAAVAQGDVVRADLGLPASS